MRQVVRLYAEEYENTLSPETWAKRDETASGPIRQMRYRYDESRGVRLKTVEIIVDEKTAIGQSNKNNPDVG